MAEEGGTGGEGDAGNGEGGEASVTFGRILPSDMMDNEGNYPKALADFQDVVIPGANLEDPGHQEFHTKLSSMAKAYADTKGMVGGMVKIPGEGATEEEVAAFRTKLGVPESADKYEVNVPEEGSASVMFSKETLTAFQEAAHKAGMSNEHVQTAVDFQNNMMQGMAKAMDAEAAEGIKSLKEEWGSADFDKNLTQAETYISKVFSEEAQKKIAVLLGNDPDITRGFVRAAQTTLDAGELKGTGETLQADTIKALQSDIDELMMSDKFQNNDQATHNKVAELITKKQKTLGTYEASIRKTSA